MPGGKGKSIGGKGGSKESAGKTQKSHSAKAGLQVSICFFSSCFPLSLSMAYYVLCVAGGVCVRLAVRPDVAWSFLGLFSFLATRLKSRVIIAGDCSFYSGIFMS